MEGLRQKGRPTSRKTTYSKKETNIKNGGEKVNFGTKFRPPAKGAR